MTKRRNLKSFLVSSALILLSALILQGCSKSDRLVLSGSIESTQIDVNSEVAGKIVRVEKELGSVVQAGDLLAAIDSTLQEWSVKQQEAAVKIKQARLDELKSGSRAEQILQAEASVKAAKAKLDELKAGSRPEQIKQAEASVESAQASVANAKTSVDTSEISYKYWSDKYDKVKALYDTKKASENDLLDARYKVDTAKQQLLTSKEQLKTAESQLKSAKAQLALLENGATEKSIEAAQANYEQAAAQLELLQKGSTSQTILAAQADLEQSQAALEQAKVILSRYNIKTLQKGTILHKNVDIGDIVNVGTSIATLSDLTDLWVHLYIPQKYLKQVSLNQEIDLTSTSLPGTTIKGKIVYIADEAEYTPKNTETSEAKENTVFQLKIKILDQIDKLKPGMTVDARIAVK